MQQKLKSSKSVFRTYIVHRIKLFSASCLLFTAAGLTAVEKNATTWIEFNMPPLAAPEGAPIDLSHLSPEPAGKHGFIRVKGDQFVDDRGIPLRFWGANVAGRGCFPTIEEGAMLAKRFRQLGMNCIRLHILESVHPYHHEYQIWDNPQEGTFSEERLQRLDHFLTNLAKEGVYANINLHCGWTYDNDWSFPVKEYGFWYEPFILKNLDFGARLMSRVNTVTGVRYADNPGIMWLEMMNEDTMQWVHEIESRYASMSKDPTHRDKIQQLRVTFRQLWTDWVRKKYQTTDALKKAWNFPYSAVPLKDWDAQAMDGAELKWIKTEDGKSIAMTKPGKYPWSARINRSCGKLKPGNYTVSFEVRSKSGIKIKHQMMYSAPPYQVVGLSRDIEAGEEWKKVEWTGTISKCDGSQPLVLAIFLGSMPADFEIRNYQLIAGGSPTEEPGWRTLAMDGAELKLVKSEKGGSLEMSTPGKYAWSARLNQPCGKLAPGKYTVSFDVRSKSGMKVKHQMMYSAPPYQVVGLVRNIDTGTDWQTLEWTDEVKDCNGTQELVLTFLLGTTPGDLEIRNYSLKAAGENANDKGQEIDLTNVGNTSKRAVLAAQISLDSGHLLPIPDASEAGEMQRDYRRFLFETELATAKRMRQNLRDIGVKVPIICSQSAYGWIGGLRVAAISDFVDIHSYHEHPEYRENEKLCYIGNTPLVKSSWGGFAIDTPYRLFGKPYTISEYNMPSPNDYAADMLPWGAILYSIQDASGFFAYAYNQWRSDYTDTKIFDPYHIIGRSNVLVHLPFSALLFRERLMPRAEATSVLDIPEAKWVDYQVLNQHIPGFRDGLGAEHVVAFSARVGSKFSVDGKEMNIVGTKNAKRGPTGEIMSEDGSFRLFRDDIGGAYATLDLPSAKMLTGLVGGRSFEIGNVKLEIAAREWPKPDTPAFSCVTLIALDGKPIETSKRLLLAASGRTTREGVKWNKEHTGIYYQEKDAWGTGENISEIVPLSLSLPGKEYRLSALTPAGMRSDITRVSKNGKIETSAADRTLWYLLERE